MEVSSHYVGTILKPYTTDISKRDTMNFAASIADNNPCYFDDENPNGIVAHPMNCVAVTWPILEKIHEFIALEDFPFQILATQVHYTEHLLLHRLMLPGDQLKIQGKIAAIIPHRAGTHMITRLDAVDENNQPVFTEFIGGLMRGVHCSDQGRQEDDIADLSAKKTDPLFSWESAILVDPLMPYIYDGCTRIHFPIHTSRQFARQVGLPDIILQGTATLALAVKEIIDRKAASDPEQIQSISCRFTDMVMPGETILLQASSPDKNNNIFFQVINSKGQRAVSRGHIKLDQ